MELSHSSYALTGGGGFIGSHFRQYLNGRDIKVKSLQLCWPYDKLSRWDGLDELDELDGLDTIIHLAGLAHNKAKNQEYCREVNTEYPIALAKLAKQKGVNCFIFLSSVNVYKTKSAINITEETEVKPIGNYATNKLAAEKGLMSLSDDNFRVVILRLPLVYASNAPANFQKLMKLSLTLPVLPFGMANNKRSYLSMNNLCSALVHLILMKQVISGVYNLTDVVDISTKQLTKGIRFAWGKNTLQLPIPIKLFSILGKLTGTSKMIALLFSPFQVNSSKFITTFNWYPVETPDEALSRLRGKND